MCRKWLAAGVGGLSLVLILVGVRYVRLPPRTYEEAVMQALNARQIRYDAVEITVSSCHSCSSSSPTLALVLAAVTVSGPQPASGWMTCAAQATWGVWTRCTLWIAAFDLQAVPLPPLVDDANWQALLQWYWYIIHGKIDHGKKRQIAAVEAFYAPAINDERRENRV